MKPKNHRMKLHTEYRWDEKVVPSVTQIAKHVPMPSLHRWYWNQGRMGIPFEATMKEAGEIGGLVHKFLQLHYDPTVEIDMDCYPQRVINQARDIADRMIPLLSPLGKPHMLETPLVCPKYGGTPDAIFTNGKHKILVDYKTSNYIHPDHYVQLGGYYLLLSGAHRKMDSGGKWIDGEPIKITEARLIHAPKSGSSVSIINVPHSVILKAAKVFKVRHLAFIIDGWFERQIRG